MTWGRRIDRKKEPGLELGEGVVVAAEGVVRRKRGGWGQGGGDGHGGGEGEGGERRGLLRLVRGCLTSKGMNTGGNTERRYTHPSISNATPVGNP